MWVLRCLMSHVSANQLQFISMLKGIGSDFHLYFSRLVCFGCCGRPGDVTRSCCRQCINCFAETRKGEK